MISLEDIRYHYQLQEDALLIMKSRTGDVKQAQADYAAAQAWLIANDAVGELLKIIEEMEKESK